MSEDRDDTEPTELPTTETGPAQESHPQQIGPYRLLQRLGEGGMGEVWEAEQTEPVRRKVALKLIKLGMDTKQVVARFEAERQALAIMNHPNVAKVFDAGVTEQGRPFFAMELVPGIPITEYCDKHRLSTRERLDLFTQVCAGIQHAHQKGIIHRDIKPSNVLVTVQDGVPFPKIIDFGIAKATTARLTESTVFTEHGHLIGTPEYMSPEQAEMTALDVDTTTDIYSLGVLLYELLTGVLPFDSKALRRAAEHEIRRIIREEEPSKPSTRLSSLGATASEVAKRRRTDVRELQKRLRGDLDWIVMRAMEKDRVRRYPSASELAADVSRHLGDEPIAARPPSLTYRLRKLAVRHRGPVFAASVVLVTLVAAVVVSTVFGLQAESRRKEAEGLRREAVWQSYVANMSAASASFRLGEVAEAKRRLSRCPPELRGWEWFYFEKRTDRSAATLRGHDGWVNWVAYSPDGKRVASGSNDWTVRLWDATSGKQLVTLVGHEYIVSSVAYSPDGTRIASGSHDSTVRLWDATSGELLATLPHEHAVNVVAFSPDGTRIASVADDGGLSLWDAASGELLTTLATLTGHEYSIAGVAFSPDGTQIASGSYDRTVRLWDAATGMLRATLAGHDEGVASVSFSPDGTCIVSGGYDKAVRLWDVDSGELLATFRGHDEDVESVAFSPDGEQIVSGSYDGTIRMWDVAPREPHAVLWGHDDAVWSVAYSPDGARIASASADRTIRLWDTALGELPAVLRGHENSVISVAYSPDGTRIASGSYDSTVGLWDAISGELLATLAEHEGRITHVVFSPDGTQIASGSSDSTVQLWDATSGELQKTIIGHDGIVGSVAFSPDGSRLLSGSFDGSARIWDRYSGDLLATLTGHDSWVISVAFSPDGTRIASASDDGTVRMWDAASGEWQETFSHSGRLVDVTFSPDGKHYATASVFGREVWLGDAASGESLVTLRGPDGGVTSLAFNPEGTRIISGSQKGTIHMWDVARGELLATLAEHDDMVWSVAFSPDGTRIASGSEDKTVRIWEGGPN